MIALPAAVTALMARAAAELIADLTAALSPRAATRSMRPSARGTIPALIARAAGSGSWPPARSCPSGRRPAPGSPARRPRPHAHIPLELIQMVEAVLRGERSLQEAAPNELFDDYDDCVGALVTDAWIPYI